MEFVVDAHNEYQAGLDINRVADEGYAGLIVKATQGTGGYRAPAAFDRWISTAHNRGMVPGAYHWLTGGSRGRDQVGAFLGRIGDPIGMICALDVEDPQNPPTWTHLYEFVQEFRQRTGGHKLLIYSGNWWWSTRGWNAASLTPYLWDSQYVSGSDVGSRLFEKVPSSWWTPRYGGWNRTTLLQFTSEALVAGQKVDVSAFDGTRMALATLAGKEGDAVAGEVSLDWHGWNNASSTATTGSRGDAVALWEAWSVLVRGLNIYQGNGDVGTSFLATNLLEVVTGVRALVAASEAEKTRDAQTAAQVATLSATVHEMSTALNALLSGGTGSGAPLDTAAILQRITMVSEQVAAEHAATRAAELANLQAAFSQARQAELAGLHEYIAILEQHLVGAGIQLATDSLGQDDEGKPSK
jgi:GH25 family lysozyme M1 (1,4-beta-N-acetylmuramidase)